MKAPHFELQVKHLGDITQTVWSRHEDFHNGEWGITSAPGWNDSWEYHIGPTPPSDQPKMCELGGLKFPMPESVAPAEEVYVFYGSETGVICETWYGLSSQIKLLNLRLVHLDMKAAEQHLAARRAANMQAVENAK